MRVAPAFMMGANKLGQSGTAVSDNWRASQRQSNCYQNFLQVTVKHNFTAAFSI
jgi:hypothetical protein